MTNGKVLGMLVLAGVLLACGGSASEGRRGGSSVSWEGDLAVALSRAETESKLVMVDFYTDWCGWCDRMDQTTFGDDRVQKALRAVVAVKLNAEREGRREAQRFGVRGYPTVIFLNTAGREVGRIPGYLPPGPFLEELDDILRRT